MYCKNCGSDIKDGIMFCPKCGKAVAGGESQKGRAFGAGGGFGSVKETGGKGSFMFPKTGNTGKISGGVQIKAGSSKKLYMILAAVAAAVIILFAVLYYNAHRKYSIVGEWVCTDLVDMGDLIDEAMNENGISGLPAEAIKGALSVWYETSGNLAFVFYERGNFEISMGGLGVSVLETTYEQMPNGKLNMNFKFTGILDRIPVDGLSFNVKCKVGKNKMTMVLFGQELEFQRKD